jgi:hypothetical protein
VGLPPEGQVVEQGEKGKGAGCGFACSFGRELAFKSHENGGRDPVLHGAGLVTTVRREVVGVQQQGLVGEGIGADRFRIGDSQGGKAGFGDL